MLASSSRAVTKRVARTASQCAEPDLAKFLHTTCIRRQQGQQRPRHLSRASETSNAHRSTRAETRPTSFDRASTRSETTRSSSRAWTTPPDTSFRGTTARVSVVTFNVRLQRALERNNAIDALQICTEMRNAGIRPDITTYNFLLGVMAKNALNREAHAIFDDMLETGIRPDFTSFNHLLFAHRRRAVPVLKVIVENMRNFGLKPQASTYTTIINSFVDDGNIEMALQELYQMSEQGLDPELPAISPLIKKTAQFGHARLSIDLALAYEDSAIRRLEADIWTECLIASAKSLYPEGVSLCWKTVVKDLNISPDEGLCDLVLHTAARHGLNELASEALQHLKTIGVTWMDRHFAAVIESFVNSGNLKGAITTLGYMRSSGLQPTIETAQPLLDSLTDLVKADGAWFIVDDMKRLSEPVDICALNLVMAACGRFGDMMRVLGIYEYLDQYGQVANMETINVLLQICVQSKYYTLGMRVIEDAKSLKLEPNSKYFEHIIDLSLAHMHEDAFFYLEEMKAHDLMPTLHIYESMARTLYDKNDARLPMLLDEMTGCGYPVTSDLKAHLNGQSAVKPTSSQLESPNASAGIESMPVASEFEDPSSLPLTPTNS